MCGIVGVRRFDGRPVDPAVLSGMAASLAHRGPDATHAVVRGTVGLAHTRLAIIDLAGSRQPMTTPDDALSVSFNGEITNYRALRRELDYPWATSGDTEVLLAMHRQFGPTGVERLRGQFSYALHDARSEDLWLVRDRTGILPLFYYSDDELFAFGSSTMALRRALTHVPALDRTRLHDYLTRRSVPAPDTLSVGIRKLPPGHRLRVAGDGRLTLERYWSLPDPDDVMTCSSGEAVDRVHQCLLDAVDDSLVSDVPVGSFLSGGVDSSLVAAVATHRHGRAINTYAAAFEGSPDNELPHARTVADLIGSHHHEVVVRAQDFEDRWAELSWYRDAPLSEPADMAVHALASLARDRVKVVLSGEGGDELFAGYPKHRWAGPMDAVGRVPVGVRRPLLLAAARRLPASGRRAGTVLRVAASTDGDRDAAWFSPFTAEERRALLPDVPPAARLGCHAGRDPLDRMLRADVSAWLPDNLLERGDRMAMSASVELRPPLLDHRFVELAFRLPSGYKVRRGVGKWVLKEVARRYLPGSIVDRRKVGFRVPLDHWFRSGLRDFAHDSLTASDSLMSELFDASAVAAVLREHDTGRRNVEAQLWTLLSLEVWHGVHSLPLPPGGAGERTSVSCRPGAAIRTGA